MLEQSIRSYFDFIQKIEIAKGRFAPFWDFEIFHGGWFEWERLHRVKALANTKDVLSDPKNIFQKPECNCS